MESLASLKNKLTGNKYHSNLLGASLTDLCRAATSRHLEEPDEIASQQVVYAINSDGAPNGAKEAVTILKKRLNMDHPQKQYLAVLLTGKVLAECSGVIGPYQGELLQDVAKIMTRPKGGSAAAGRAKQAAMDLLRQHGAAGQDAFRMASRVNRPTQQPHFAGGVVGGVPMQPGMQADPAAAASFAAERASVLDEVKRMTDQARGSTELLSDLLVNRSAGTAPDEFELQLTKELLGDVKELRTMLAVYLEQLSNMEGPDAEAAMCGALEALDVLDNATALERDVEAEIKEATAQGLMPPPAAAAAAAAGASLAPSGAPAPRAPSMNLIDFADDSGPSASAAGPSGTGVGSGAASADPFATSALGGPGTGIAADPFADMAPAWAGAGAGVSGVTAGLAATTLNPGTGGADGAAGGIARGSSSGNPTSPGSPFGVSALTAKSPFLQAGMQQGQQEQEQQQQQQQQGQGPGQVPGGAAPPQQPHGAPSGVAGGSYGAAGPSSHLLPQQTSGYMAQPTGGYITPQAAPGYAPQQTGGYGGQLPGSYAPQQTGGAYASQQPSPYGPQVTGGYGGSGGYGQQQMGGSYAPQQTGGYMQQQTGGYGQQPANPFLMPQGQPQQQQQQGQQGGAGGFSVGSPTSPNNPFMTGAISNPFMAGGQQQQQQGGGAADVADEWDRLFSNRVPQPAASGFDSLAARH